MWEWTMDEQLCAHLFLTAIKDSKIFVESLKITAKIKVLFVISTRYSGILQQQERESCITFQNTGICNSGNSELIFQYISAILPE